VGEGTGGGQRRVVCNYLCRELLREIDLAGQLLVKGSVRGVVGQAGAARGQLVVAVQAGGGPARESGGGGWLGATLGGARPRRVGVPRD
jgi:hypothetical protein